MNTAVRKLWKGWWWGGSIVLLLAAVALSATVWQAPAARASCTVTWDGGAATTNWGDAANWNPDGVPGVGAEVCLDATPDATITIAVGGSIDHVHSDEDIVHTAGTLTLANASDINGTYSQSGGAISGAGSLTINGLATWTGGQQLGTGSTTYAAGLSISGAATKGLDSRTLNNATTATWTGTGAITTSNSATINNQSGATWDVQAGVTLSHSGGAVSQFNNAGAFTRSAGVGTHIIGIPFNNSGSATISTATVNFSNGGTSSGSFTPSAGATFNFAGGHTLGAASSVSGGGTMAFNTGSVTIDGTYNMTGTTTAGGAAITFSSPVTDTGTLNLVSGTTNFNAAATVSALNMALGTLSGSGAVMVTGPTNWSAGAMSGTGTTTASGGLSITGTGIKSLTRTLNNAGAATWTGTSNISSGNGAVFNNQLGATFDIQNNQNFNHDLGGALPQFNNAGSLTKTIATLRTNFGVAFNNTGSVVVSTGTVSANNTGTSSGSFSAAAGANFTFGGGVHTLMASSSTGGAGTTEFLASTVNHAGTHSASGITLVSGSNATFTGTMPGAGTFNVAGGVANVSTSAGASTTTMNLTNGTLSGTAALNVSGLTTWSGGAMSGSGSTNANGGLSIGGSVAKTLNTRTLNNAGAATFSGTGNIDSGQGATFNNLSTGTFDHQSNTAFNFSTGGTATKFNNAGTFTRTVGTLTASYTVIFNNSGSATVSTGTLHLVGGGTAQGSFSVASGAGLSLSSAPYTFQATSSVGGAGTLTFNASGIAIDGSYNVTGATKVISGSATWSTAVASTGALEVGGTATFNAAASPTSLLLGGGTLTGPGTVTVGGLTTWTGGTMDGLGGVTNANGGLSISGVAIKTLKTRTINNAGAATFSGTGSIDSGQGATFNNLSTGSFDHQGNSAFNFNAGGTATQFNNAGTFTRTVGTGTASYNGVTFNNSGSVTLSTGTLHLVGGGTASGSLSVASGAGLSLSSSYTFQATSSVSGTGTITFNTGAHAIGGTYNVTGTTKVTGGSATWSTVVTSAGALEVSNTATFNAAASATSLLLNAGALTGTGTVTVSGLTTWTGGTMSGSGVTNANGGMSISGSAARSLVNRTLNNGGAATFTASANIDTGSGAVFNNLASGIFDHQTDRGILHNLGGAGTQFQNAGTFRRTVGVGTANYGAFFNNTGSAAFSSGTTAFASGYNQSGGASLTMLDGGNVSSSLVMFIDAGTLGGSGTITGTVNNSGASVGPGASPGVLTITGGYTQDPTGTLLIEIGGLTLGSQYDRLAVGGLATLDGTLDVDLINAYSPNDGDVFRVLTFGSRSGDFSTKNLGQACLLTFTDAYDATGLDLTADVQDADCDGIPDVTDNCPTIVNPGQENNVHPGSPAGDHCDDPDGDGVYDITDNCPDASNPGQSDADGDGLGDKCDTEGPSPNVNGLGGADDCNDGVDNDGDTLTDGAEAACDGDGDGVSDVVDNCPLAPNPTQSNVDGDSFGDKCDTEGPSPNTTGLGGADDCTDGVDNDGDTKIDGADTGCDSDGDGVADVIDNCPLVPNVSQANADSDSFGDACDTEGPSPNTNGLAGADDCTDGIDNDGDTLIDGAEAACDGDGDGVSDVVDNCPLAPNPTQSNVDGDSFGDKCDTEGPSPNTNGVAGADDCTDGVDNDGDTKIDGADTGCDSDGDGVADIVDNCPTKPNPLQSNVDADAFGDACDTEGPPGNTNGVGGTDDCLDTVDNDGDTLIDAADLGCQLDGDGDGVPDATDNCPAVPNPGQEDGDGDTVGNVCDNCPVTPNAAQTNGDGDQHGNACDNCPTVTNANQLNTDGDNFGNACDNCTSIANNGQENADGDPLGDACDNCPLFSTVWVVPPGDSDCDFFTDAHEAFMGTLVGDRCAATGQVTSPPGVNDEPPPDGWPGDFNDNQIVNSIDVGTFVPRLNESTGDPLYNVRWDLNANGTINSIDIGRLVPLLNKTCTPD